MTFCFLNKIICNWRFSHKLFFLLFKTIILQSLHIDSIELEYSYLQFNRLYTSFKVIMNCLWITLDWIEFIRVNVFTIGGFLFMSLCLSEKWTNLWFPSFSKVLQIVESFNLQITMIFIFQLLRLLELRTFIFLLLFWLFIFFLIFELDLW